MPLRERTHSRGFLLAYSGRGWCTPPSAWSRRETRSIPTASVRGGSEGRASATRGSRWREAAPSGGRPAVCRPGSGEWWRSYWAGPEQLKAFSSSSMAPFFSSVFFTKHQRPSLPIFFLVTLFPAKKSLHSWTCEENKLVTFMMVLRTLLVEGEIQTSPSGRTVREASLLST